VVPCEQPFKYGNHSYEKCFFEASFSCLFSEIGHIVDLLTWRAFNRRSLFETDRDIVSSLLMLVKCARGNIPTAVDKLIVCRDIKQVSTVVRSSSCSDQTCLCTRMILMYAQEVGSTWDSLEALVHTQTDTSQHL
jgi:hypothetical protein